MDDGALLRCWAERGDEGAVHILTQRHAGLVLGTARRVLRGDKALAEEAAQAVFTVMAAKAANLKNHPALKLWLHRAALLEASGLRRREARRNRRPALLAVELNAMNTHPAEPSWHEALPQLDDALTRLPEADRHLLILRYYEGCSFKDLAARLGKGDHTLQKQASRALEKLSGLLRRRGVVIPAAMLGAAFLNGSAQASVPVSLANSLASAATANAAHFRLIPTLHHTYKLMTCGHLKSHTISAAVLLLALCAGGGYVTGSASAESGIAASPKNRPPHGADRENALLRLRLPSSGPRNHSSTASCSRCLHRVAGAFLVGRRPRGAAAGSLPVSPGIRFAGRPCKSRHRHNLRFAGRRYRDSRDYRSTAEVHTGFPSGQSRIHGIFVTDQ